MALQTRRPEQLRPTTIPGLPPPAPAFSGSPSPTAPTIPQVPKPPSGGVTMNMMNPNIDPPNGDPGGAANNLHPPPVPPVTPEPPPGPRPARPPVAAGGGGGGGSSSSGAPAAGGTGTNNWDETHMPFANMQSTIWNQINGILKGNNVPFPQEVIDALRGQAFSSTQGRAQADVSALNEDMASRGLGRSTFAASRESGIRRAASSEYTKASREIRVQAVTANYQAKMEGIARAQALLDSSWQFLLSHEQNEVARETGMAQVQLGYANIANQMKMLQMQLAQQLALAHSGGSTPSFNPSSVLPP